MERFSENNLEEYIERLEDWLNGGYEYQEELKKLIAIHEKQKITTDPDDMFRGQSGEVAKANAEKDLESKRQRVQQQLARAIKFRDSGSYTRAAREYTKERKRGINYSRKWK